jgi:hypothetical protein
VELEDSWGDEVALDDLNQSDEEVTKKPVKKMANIGEVGEWISEEECEDEGGNSWEEAAEPQVEVDETAALADKL